MTSKERPRAEPWMLVALAAWLAITVSWWALALWPVPADTPEWLLRARYVCFNTTDSGLPDGSGWLMLIGQPIGMLAVLFAAWRDTASRTFAALGSGAGGRAVLAAVALLLVAGIGAAGARVAGASSTPDVVIPEDELHSGEGVPSGIEVAPLRLTDHSGRSVDLADYRGRPVLLTFAFGHCETVCPAVVRNAEEVRREIPEPERPALLVVTLDPWRDTPGRLQYMYDAWGLSDGAAVLGGDVEDVNRTLDAWSVGRSRDRTSGDIRHAPLVYVVDASGEKAFPSRGASDSLRRLLMEAMDEPKSDPAGASG